MWYTGEKRRSPPLFWPFFPPFVPFPDAPAFPSLYGAFIRCSSPQRTHPRLYNPLEVTIHEQTPDLSCSATSFLRNWDSILEKKPANLRSISEPARLRQPPPRSTGAAHARGRAQSIREERRIAAPPVLFALLWVRLLPALYGPFCGPLRPFGGCPLGVTPPARECLPPAPPDTRRRG